MSFVVPSLYAPVAVNCRVVPLGMEAVAGVTLMDISVTGRGAAKTWVTQVRATPIAIVRAKAGRAMSMLLWMQSHTTRRCMEAPVSGGAGTVYGENDDFVMGNVTRGSGGKPMRAYFDCQERRQRARRWISHFTYPRSR